MAKEKELVPFSGAGVVPGLSLREMRRTTLMEGGLLKPRKQYESKEARKAASKERAKERRESRKAFLEKKGVAPSERVKLTKAQKKV